MEKPYKWLIIALFILSLLYSLRDWLPADNYYAAQLEGLKKKNILIKFKEGVGSSGERDLLLRHSLRPVSAIMPLGIIVVQSALHLPPENVLKRLEERESGNVEFAEIDELIPPSLLPDDPWFANWQKNKQLINTPLAWDNTSGSGALVIAVLDTGVNCYHEDLAPNCIPGWNFFSNNSDTSDTTGHGTKVAGIISAVGNNSIGVAGTSWNSKIMPLRVGDASGYASLSTIANAITYAADNGAKIANASYEISGSRTIDRAGSYLRKKGGVLTSSAGNGGIYASSQNSPNIIVASAVDAGDARYSWSNFGKPVDISAPGCTGATTANNGGYESFCGTSASAPETAGVLALIFSVNQNFLPGDAESILFSSAKDLGTSGWDEYYGWGRIDAYAAVQKALVTEPSIPSSDQNPSKRK